MSFRYKVSYPTVIRKHNVELTDIGNWLRDNVGEPGTHWYIKNLKIYIRFKKDYTWFILRWS
jgi:hypothetical protein